MPASEHQRRRRRRRRRGTRPEAGAAPGAPAAAEAGQGGEQQQQRRERGPRRRGRERRDGDRPRRDSERPEHGPREERREGQNRPQGERRERDGERGPRRGKGGKPFGKGAGGGDRGRDGRRDKPAPKLYSFESIVDRGFEEVAAPPSAEGEATAESGSRRVDWTIVKRTVADQRAAKTVSALYILKRDGAETEFPNLGAARAAVNKTIVHPEKLTRPKTDYPSTKK